MIIHKPVITGIRWSSFIGRSSSFAAVALFATTGNLAAQSPVVERNLPPAVSAAAPTVSLPDEAVIAADEQPLGPDLVGIRLIGPEEQPDIGRTRGIVIGGIGEGKNLEPELVRVLRPLIGRPLSMSLIADAQSTIAGVYRHAGYPFVSVTIPPQEITAGVVNLRVMEFKFGSVTARSAGGTAASGLAAQVRVPEAGRISSASVNEDLAWLNRSPFRRVQGLFSPGSATGNSDLVLDVTSGKPWQVYAGYSNTGTKATGHDRFFLGAGLAIPGIDGAFGTYQLTGSSDLFEDLSGLFPDHSDDRARYLSHSARFVLPLDGRQAIDFSPSYIATRQTEEGFTFDSTIIELPLYYRSALSNILPGIYGGEVYAGVEYKHLSRDTFFAGLDLGGAQAEVFQLGFGWTHRFADDLGSTEIDLHIKANPGGLFGDNTASAWNVYSNGTVADTSYAYLAGSVIRDTELATGFRFSNNVVFQLAGQSLPDTERLSIGGLDGVRGYGLNDAVADTGIILRNELRLPTLSPFGNDRFSPFVFIDLGFGWDRISDEKLSLAGTGFGVDYSLAQNLNFNATAAFALVDEGSLSAGDFDFKLRLTARY